jgi:hypothetical protein
MPTEVLDRLVDELEHCFAAGGGARPCCESTRFEQRSSPMEYALDVKF